MGSFWEYHVGMRFSISACTALLGLMAIVLFFGPSLHAQINGAPASVTSPGFGGRPVNGPPASVTSVGPQGYTPVPRPGFIPNNSVHHGNHNGNHGNHDGQRGRNSNAVGPVWYAVPVPYAVDNGAMQDQPDAADDESNYQGGPTVFDRRGNGEGSYVPPTKEAAPAHAADRVEDDPPPVDPEPPLPPTLLVFKDGRTLEVGNYAIQGSTLFDLTPGHRRKILIADLDLDATRKQNDERGVTFQLPQSTRVN